MMSKAMQDTIKKHKVEAALPRVDFGIRLTDARYRALYILCSVVRAAMNKYAVPSDMIIVTLRTLSHRANASKFSPDRSVVRGTGHLDYFASQRIAHNVRPRKPIEGYSFFIAPSEMSGRNHHKYDENLHVFIEPSEMAVGSGYQFDFIIDDVIMERFLDQASESAPITQSMDLEYAQKIRDNLDEALTWINKIEVIPDERKRKYERMFDELMDQLKRDMGV